MRRNNLKEINSAKIGFGLDKKLNSKNSIKKTAFNQSNKAIPAFAVLLSLFSLLAALAFAIPNSLTLQGKLTSPGGVSQQGTFTFMFRMYDIPNYTYYNVTQNITLLNETNGSTYLKEANITYINYTNILWEQNQSVTTDANGVYDVILHNINLSFADQYYLGITIGTDNESTPRINLTSSPYSFRANVSEDLNANHSYIVTNLSITGNATIGSGGTTLAISTQTFNLTAIGNIFSAGNLSIAGNSFFVDSLNSRIGIGTNLPHNTLTVIGSMDVSGSLNASSINATQRLIINNTLFVNGSRVGIGTSSPTDGRLLDARGNATFGVSGADTSIGLRRASDGAVAGEIRLIGSNLTIFNSQSSGNIDFFTGDATRMFISSTGNVGIGTTAPNYLLQVASGTDGRSVNLSNVLYVNGSSGNVGIGTTTPQNPLEVIGAVTVAGTLNASSLNVTGNAYFATSSGNVGIGTASPASKLVVVGSANITGGLNVSGDTNISGNFYVTGNAVIGDSSSDAVEVNAQIASNLIPNANNRDLGSASNFWRRAYIDLATISNLSVTGNTTVGGTTSPTFTLNSNYTGDDTRDVELIFERGTPITNAVFKWDAANKRFDINFPLFIQDGNNLTVDTNTLFVDGSINKVGIGTTGPQNELEVIGAVTVAGTLNASSLNVTGNAYFATASGNVGIGKISPNFKLDVAGTINASGLLLTNGTFSVGQGGRIGIGVSNPATALHVIGNVTINDSTRQNSIFIDSEANAILFQGENGSLYQPVYGSDDDLVLYLPFSENTINTSNRTYDRSPFGNDGTLYNMNNGDPNNGTWTAGKYGYAMKFDGVNDFINVTTHPSIALSTLTGYSITVWVKTSAQATQIITIRNVAGVGVRHQFSLEDLGSGSERISLGGFGVSGIGGDTVEIFDNKWHHVAVTVLNQSVQFYLDGAKAGGGTFTGSGWDSDGFDKHIGYDPVGGVNPFNGTMDELMIYKRALAPEEIRTHYLRGSGFGAMGAVTADKFRVVNTSANVQLELNQTSFDVRAITGSSVFLVDKTNLRVGINQTSPTSTLHAVGTVNLTNGAASFRVTSDNNIVIHLE